MNNEAVHKPLATQPDPRVRLAFERTFLAYERTRIAWVRTALALITFGFASQNFFSTCVRSTVKQLRCSVPEQLVSSTSSLDWSA